jgi:hypothetical protein
MADIQVVAVDGGITRLIERLTVVSKNGYKPFLDDLGTRWEKRISDQFTTTTNPYALPWKKLASFTIKVKKSKGYSQPSRQLFATGALSKSFYTIATAKTLKLRSRKQEIADKHNIGGFPASAFPFQLVPQRQIVPAADKLPETWQSDIDAAFVLLRNYILG